MPLGALLTNDREPVQIESVELNIESAERVRAATVERVWIDRTEIRRGRTVPLKILLRTYRGEDIVHTIPVPIPLNAAGPLTILVADGARFAQWEAREGRPQVAPDTVDGMITHLNDARRANRLYVRLVGRDAGAIVGSEPMPGLPSSVLAVVGSDRAGGGGAALQSTTLGAWEIRVGQAVSGQRALMISLDGDRPRP